VRKVDAAPEPGKSYELWVISDRLGAPRSLGVIGDGDFTARPALAAYDPGIVRNATLRRHGRTIRRFAKWQTDLAAGVRRQADRDRAAGFTR